jgi:hypothetical protein
MKRVYEFLGIGKLPQKIIIHVCLSSDIYINTYACVGTRLAT